MRYLILTSVIWITACGGSSEKEKQLLSEASAVHNQAVALARMTMITATTIIITDLPTR